MTTLLILGGSGHTGSFLATEAVRRGYTVVSASRNAPAEPVPEVTYRNGNLLEAGFREEITTGADVIVSALSPRSDLAGNMVRVLADIADRAAASSAVLAVVGTFTDLRASKDSPRFLDAGSPERYAAYDEFRGESLELVEVLHHLRDRAPGQLAWTYISPAAEYGQWRHGEARGTYRLSDDTALFDDSGESFISSPDFAAAVLDVVEAGSHHRSHVSVAY